MEQLTLWTSRMMRSPTIPHRRHWTGCSHWDGRFQDISIFWNHQNRDEIHDCQGQELCLLGFLLQRGMLESRFSIDLLLECLNECSHHISVDDGTETVHIHVLQKFLGILHRIWQSFSNVLDKRNIELFIISRNKRKHKI